MTLVLNLGCGSNLMKGAINVDIVAQPGVDIVADAVRLPFADETFAEVHAINPHGFYPVSEEIWRVLQPHGLLYVSGSPRNKNAKPLAAVKAQAVGFAGVQTTPILPIHVFGTQRTSKGGRLQTRNPITTLYRRLP